MIQWKNGETNAFGETVNLLDIDLFTTQVACEIFSFSRDVATQHDLLRNENQNLLDSLRQENDFLGFECVPEFFGSQGLEDTLNKNLLPPLTKACMKALEQGVPEQVVLGVLQDCFKEKRLLNIVPHTEISSEQDSLMDVVNATAAELANWKPLFKKEEGTDGVFSWQDLEQAKVNTKIKYEQLVKERRQWYKAQRDALTHEEDNLAERKKEDADVARNTLYRLHLARCLRSSFTQDALEASLLMFVGEVCEELENLSYSPNPALLGLGIHYKKEYESLRKGKQYLVPQVYSSLFEDLRDCEEMDEVDCWALRYVSLPYLLLTSDVERLAPEDNHQGSYAVPLVEFILQREETDGEGFFKPDLYVCQKNLREFVENHGPIKDGGNTIHDDTKQTCMMIADLILNKLTEDLGNKPCLWQYDFETKSHKTKQAHLKVFGHQFGVFLGMHGKELSLALFNKIQEHLVAYPKEQVWAIYKQNLPLFVDAVKDDIACEKTLEDDADFLKQPLMDFFHDNDRKLALLINTHKPSLFKHR